ncbi:MAG: lipoate--protein ligase family protein [Bacteroidota bacterium]
MVPSDPQRWEYCDSGVNTGAYNMRFDMDLAERLLRGEILPTLRIYGWRPWAVSLGYNQSENDIDLKRCAEFGYDVVRRPTGGRAILHSNELTYSVVMPADGRGITEIYSLISKALVSGLSTICSDISYETSQPNFQTLYKRQESIPCFSASARYEVQINGKKLVGSAQRRFSSSDGPEVVLQHGSILLGPEHRMLAEILRVSDEEIRTKITNDIETKTIDLSTAVGRTVTFEEAAAVLKHGFERTMNIHFEKTIGASL